MNMRSWLLITAGIIPLAAGCGGGRVHIRPELAQIDRVAVINLAEVKKDQPLMEGEYFTNEFVSVGFMVVERGHLQDVLREAFTQSGYLDERTVAQEGRGLGIKGVVLHQMKTSTVAVENGRPRYEVSGWVRIVEAEQGVIVLSYNPEPIFSMRSPDDAARQYAQRAVDDIKTAMREQRINPAPIPANVVPPKPPVLENAPH